MDRIERLERVEAQLEIGQLPIRYALAVDARDVDAWLDLFVPDRHCNDAGYALMARAFAARLRER